ncbi:MAG TPA: PEGA domain-containing protein [Vicinamibacterales bacterium]|nr:PEGA domain-containing protein [Vicinamibacterales bacterium]
MSAPALAQAQRRGGGGRGPRVVVAPRPVVVSPFYSGFYRPYYSPFFWDVYGWGFPGVPGFGFYNRAYVEDSSARIQVTPKHAEVYVDGYRAGIVDDFDGFAQRLHVPPGEHVIELYLEGHKTISQAILFQPGESYRIRHTMEPLAAGEPEPARPAPRPNTNPAPRADFDAFGRPVMRGPAPASPSREGASLLIRVQPGDAVVIVDGERWQNSGDRLEIQVTPGEHRIEIQKDGYQPFRTTVRVQPGESSPINVSLTKSGDEQ